MRRRDFLALAVGAAVSPVESRGQRAGGIARVGVLWHAGSAEEEDIWIGIIKKSFSDLGYLEGKTLMLEHRFPAEQADRFRSMAQELVQSKLDAIMAVNELAAKELRRATSNIPIVMVAAQDPVAAGLADSLAHPGGNVTGLSVMAVDLSGKRLALLKEAIPSILRPTLMIDPKDPSSKRVVSASLVAAKQLDLELRIAEVSTPSAIDSALAELASGGSDALVVGPGSLMMNERTRIGDFVSAKKLPTEVAAAEVLPFGGLLSYGHDFSDYFRRAVAYVDKILKGANPADLPIEQPTRFKLTINLNTAKLIGLSISPTLLARADEVIE